MPHYVVNRRADEHGDHRVHDRASIWSCLPDEADRRELGSHDGGASAVRLATAFYGRANGCERCLISQRVG